MGNDCLLSSVRVSPMSFDLREVGKSLVLVGPGTVIVVGLFALLIAAHPSAGLAVANAPTFMGPGQTHVAGTR
jgi:hypothetical protein